jgi:hypothetical protein
MLEVLFPTACERNRRRGGAPLECSRGALVVEAPDMTKPFADIWRGIPHCRIRADVTSSNAWRVLGHSSKALYLDLRARLRMGTNGNVSAALGDLRHVGWASSATLAQALYELLAVDLLIRTRSGGVERGSKVCSLYAFTDLDVIANPKFGIERSRATFAYLNLKTIAEAEFALESGVAKLRQEALERKGKSTPQKKNSASDSEAVKPFCASDSEAVGHFSASNSEAVKRGRNAA